MVRAGLPDMLRGFGGNHGQNIERAGRGRDNDGSRAGDAGIEAPSMISRALDTLSRCTPPRGKMTWWRAKSG
eukprot:1254073-Amorphochlora_amoeboformis.AAC.2